MYDKKKREQMIDDLDTESARKLFSITQFVKQINRNSYQHNDLFTLYLNKVIGNLFDLASSAVNKNEIKIEDNMLEVTSELYNSAFIGDAQSIFRPMYICNDNEFFFKGFGKNYFSLAKTLVDKRKIKKVKRLFIYTSESELLDERIQKLIHFHNTTTHYECKVLSLSRYNQIKNDFRLTDLMGSFAVYGSRYLYTERTSPTIERVIGYYSKNTTDINKFIHFFEQCWNQGCFHTITTKKIITLDDVFNEMCSL